MFTSKIRFEIWLQSERLCIFLRLKCCSYFIPFLTFCSTSYLFLYFRPLVLYLTFCSTSYLLFCFLLFVLLLTFCSASYILYCFLLFVLLLTFCFTSYLLFYFQVFVVLFLLDPSCCPRCCCSKYFSCFLSIPKLFYIPCLCSNWQYSLKWPFWVSIRWHMMCNAVFTWW